ncbi:response regulator transcription factor [Alkalicoccus chagannorensis]|uniref:response regulator transcription factor n=1 Tax=Alkalicoccus chagannorensis TaxID=427072 RepID=UPI0003FBED7F|nr:response regulator transcription factor [Alkalicoccus chagannorensis]
MKLAVVDDQRLVYEGFQSLLNMQEDMSCPWTFATGEQCLEALDTIDVDILLMDIRMPGIGGIETVRRAKKKYPSLRILMLTTFHDRSYIIEAMKAGADGYMLKDAPIEKLAEAVRTVHRTGGYLAESVTSTVLDYIHSTSSPSAYEHQWQERYALSDRELQVITLMKKGLSNQDIGSRLSISPGTVKNHVSHIMDKMDLRERNHITIYALTGERPDERAD